MAASAHLFSPLTIKEVTLRNRIGVSPMCQYSSEDGFFNDWHLVHLGSRAVGGAGLVIVEATAVSPIGRISPWDAGLWKDEQIEFLRRITDFIKTQGAVAGMQLAHAGRKASTAPPWDGGHSLDEANQGWQTIAPSPIAFGDDITHVPREMTRQDIAEVQQQFVDATERTLAAGFNWLELHAAHGYLLHSFLSPLSNHRSDEYGGSFENRIRMTIDVTRAIRQVWPDHYPLAVRLSVTDWVDGGWTLAESVELAKRLKSEGVDIIDCSSGFNTPDADQYPFGSGFQIPHAHQIRSEADIPTATVGFITSPQQADQTIRNGQADLVLMAREFLRSPYWVFEAAAELRHRDPEMIPKQYARAFG